jgi:hypothetical protein
VSTQKKTTPKASKKMPISRINSTSSPDDSERLTRDIVQLARLGLAGRNQDFQVYLQRLSRRLRSSHPQLANEILDLIRQSPTRSSPLRDAPAGVVHPAPVDVDSRLDLLRHEFIDELPAQPIWGSGVGAPIQQLIAERGAWDRLADAGLSPTRTALLIGAPGVGKTLAARYVAHELGLPLLVLDLAAVMSSLLGRTGTNIRQVMDYAKARPCVLLLDEFDAVAKRRDDFGDVGELKRLVTVLLQAVDDWPASGLLLAATNHPDLLDPAAWRRFEMVVEFPLPNADQVGEAVDQFLIPGPDIPAPVLAAVKSLLLRKSYSEIEREMVATRRRAAIGDGDLGRELAKYVSANASALPVGERAALAADAIARGEMSQHKAHEFFSVSRDVIRRASSAQQTTTPKRSRG